MDRRRSAATIKGLVSVRNSRAFAGRLGTVRDDDELCLCQHQECIVTNLKEEC